MNSVVGNDDRPQGLGESGESLVGDRRRGGALLAMFQIENADREIGSANLFDLL